MGVYLVTGQPGHGKTAYALDMAFKWQKEGRTIYAHGVKDLDYDKAKFKHIDDPTRWEDLPDGSVILLDECYSHFPNRNPGAKVPAHVDAVARHRHRGFDFIMVAQQGLQLDPFLRGLFEEHVHCRQTSIMKSKTKLKRWTAYQSNVNVQCMDTRDWVRPKYVFDYYTSTTMVTTRRSIPMWMRYTAVLIAAVCLGVFYLKSSMDKKMHPHGDVTVTGAAPAAADGKSSGGRGGTASDLDQPKWKEPLDYAKDHLPRFASMPWTAPVYDQRQVTVDPQLLCMSSQAGVDGQGKHVEGSCHCVTEQNTVYEMSEAECRRVARVGPPYNPYRQTAASTPAAPVAPVSPTDPGTPSISSVKGTQMATYGDIGVAPPQKIYGTL